MLPDHIDPEAVARYRERRERKNKAIADELHDKIIRRPDESPYQSKPLIPGKDDKEWHHWRQVLAVQRN